MRDKRGTSIKSINLTEMWQSTRFEKGTGIDSENRETKKRIKFDRVS